MMTSLEGPAFAKKVDDRNSCQVDVRLWNHNNNIGLCRKEMVLLNMTSLECRRSQVMLSLMFVSGTIATT